MPKYPSLDRRKNTYLPEAHFPAHELCFVIHDIMVQIIFSGRRSQLFNANFKFKDKDDELAFDKANGILNWLDKTSRVEERADILVKLMFTHVLGDMLNCIYEALETSRKGKLAVSYMLLRKPLQESLFLMEAAVLDRFAFAENLATVPMRLWSQKAGGVDVHARRIREILAATEGDGLFDADYIAQLRYDKDADDGFDGVCNTAMHLFTGHPAIKTEPLNINFVFSNRDNTKNQWSYIYSRLPYIMTYMHRVVEYLCETIEFTDPVYLQDMDRRISAHVLVWSDTLAPRYREKRIEAFVAVT